MVECKAAGHVRRGACVSVGVEVGVLVATAAVTASHGVLSRDNQFLSNGT